MYLVPDARLCSPRAQVGLYFPGEARLPGTRTEFYIDFIRAYPHDDFVERADKLDPAD